MIRGGAVPSSPASEQAHVPETVGVDPVAVDVDDWRAVALCRGRGALFFAIAQFSERIASALCRRCPSREPCLAEALATDALGVWGATNYGQRQAMRSRS